MRTRTLAPAFVLTALGGAALAKTPPKKPAPLPPSRAGDPIRLFADGTCTQAATPCGPEGCAPDAAWRPVRCPAPPRPADLPAEPLEPHDDGVCRTIYSPKESCGPTDCGDRPCPPVSCNPPPPQLIRVPCAGEGTTAQLQPQPAVLPDGSRLVPLVDGDCELVPMIPKDFRCPEGATCNPPAPYIRPCPSPAALQDLMRAPKKAP